MSTKNESENKCEFVPKLETIKENIFEENLEKILCLYKQFKSFLLFHCKENNGLSDLDNFMEMIAIIEKENNIDKFINESQNVVDWTETKLWKSEILDLDYDNLECELSKEDLMDPDELSKINLFDDDCSDDYSNCSNDNTNADENSKETNVNYDDFY